MKTIAEQKKSRKDVAATIIKANRKELETLAMLFYDHHQDAEHRYNTVVDELKDAEQRHRDAEHRYNARENLIRNVERECSAAQSAATALRDAIRIMTQEMMQ